MKGWTKAKDIVGTYTDKFIDNTIAKRIKDYIPWVKKRKNAEFPYKDLFKENYQNIWLNEYIDRYHQDEKIHKILVDEVIFENHKDYWELKWPTQHEKLKPIENLMDNEDKYFKKNLGKELWEASQERARYWHELRYQFKPVIPNNFNIEPSGDHTAVLEMVNELRGQTRLIYDKYKNMDALKNDWQAAIYRKLFKIVQTYSYDEDGGIF